jgi:predicted acyltransferase
MDQFRGYTVAGMFVVNFLSGLQAIPAVLAHHNTYFSYADSIFPSFLFAVGFSYRLTILRRLERAGWSSACWTYFKRSAALVLVSLVIYGYGDSFPSWGEVTGEYLRGFLARFLKAGVWEVLAIIGVTQILIMPVVAARPAVRAAAIVCCVVAHTLLSYSFNFEFVYGRPNWMDDYWGAAGKRAWDGGFFGLLSWAVPMLAGTLAYDIVAGRVAWAAARRLALWGAVLMAIGYALSCLTRLYDVPPGTNVTDPIAGSPVWPPMDRLEGWNLQRFLAEPGSLLAEPPFVQPPPWQVRQHNYWMMGKRAATASFVLFSSGFAFAAYALFVGLCDIGGFSLGMFRTFGQNPLAAYAIHAMVRQNLKPIVPHDAPLWYCTVGMMCLMGVVYLLVRHLEKHDIYVRL